MFFTVRALLALFPALTAGFPIKKSSAAAALAAASFYVLLSGAEVATQRSYFIIVAFPAAAMLLGLFLSRVHQSSQFQQSMQDQQP